ncbi:MAG: hypothetical protein MJ175_12415, partial [Clostridia bacterium]|nr:hypothetical protein [Clostridia bacterium]
MKTKLKTIALILFCIFFFGMCTFFSLGMLIPGASEAAEGAEFPHFLEDGKISREFGTDMESWFSKRFAYRGTVVNAFAALKERLFTTGNDQVVVGEDGFLFFAETLDCYMGNNPMTDKEVNAAADSLAALYDYADEHGAKFLFVCAPDKNTIYPEMMPSRYRKTEAPTDLDRLYDALEERGVPHLDLRPVLTAAKEVELIYHKRDTHWNGIGARAGYLAMMEALSLPVPGELPTEPTRVRDFDGDLDSLMYPEGAEHDDHVFYDASALYAYTSAFSTPMDMQITTRSAGKAGNLLFFRDSFGNALIGDFACSFQNMRMERAIPYRIDLLETDKVKADTVIVM